MVYNYSKFKQYGNSTLLVLLLLLIWSLSANAGFSVLDNRLRPMGVNSYSRYIRDQIQFLNNLRTCRPFRMQVANPLQPAVTITKTILGRSGRYCRVTKSLVINKRGSIPSYLSYCYYDRVQIDIMTSPIEYEYIRALTRIHHFEHDLALDSPEMTKIDKIACRQLTEGNIAPIAKFYSGYGK